MEARFDDPIILEGYGFSFFGNKGYTFSPVFARDHIIVQFQGHFVSEIPDDKFTVVLKKVRGEDSVPLFQTLTFHIDIVHPHEASGQGHFAGSEHLMALYEMSGQFYDTVATGFTESTTALYAVASIICATLLLIVGKVCWSRRQATKAELASIEAFAYDEKATVVTNAEEDAENNVSSSNQAYHNLAGARPTTPAVF